MAQRIKHEKPEPKIPEVLISWDEFKRRKKVWDEFYAKAKQSRECERLAQQKEALKKGDLETVRRLGLEAREQLISGVFSQKPLFPDPELQRIHGRLGIKQEDIISQAREIFSKGANGNE